MVFFSRARDLAPTSIRALYGISDTRNATHGSGMLLLLSPVYNSNQGNLITPYIGLIKVIPLKLLFLYRYRFCKSAPNRSQPLSLMCLLSCQESLRSRLENL